ncbi:MAG: methyltransferase domain-containing protein, partial [Oleiphilaceae bacterium]|nr:methyltransferase domain-containing protein [Oleiphilaceae bacterium]
MDDQAIRTEWTDSLERGARPESAALRAHLQAVHRDHAGFTESCAKQCRDPAGRTSYEWLAEAVETDRHRVMLDLACGSGPLLQLCHETLPAGLRLIGVDMSPDELALARDRLPPGRVELIEAEAQKLDFLEDESVDIALCHWALTLMDPIMPVLNEVARVVARGGRFAVLVDGPMDATQGYEAVHDLIYRHVQARLPDYGLRDLGDQRVRNANSLVTLIEEAFPGSSVSAETGVVTMSGPARAVA